MEGLDRDSEISGSSCSIVSEPPDIRIWFSSYEYESFVLDTCENFGGIFSEERESDKDELTGKIDAEKEQNLDGSAEIRKADEHGNSNSKVVRDSLHSPSILSEPTDIRNWFSSYVYESPSLDTNDGFKSNVPGESQCEKGELIGESIKDELANSFQFQETKNSCKQNAYDSTSSTKLVRCSSSLVDRKNESHSHPLFSEPPDIGHWFPDHVYSSPVLDTSDEFRDSLSVDGESNEDKFAVGDSNIEKQRNVNTTRKTRCRNEVVVGKEISSNVFGKCTSSQRQYDQKDNKYNSKDLHWAGGKENLFWQDDMCFKKILDPRLEVKQVQSSRTKSNEGVENGEDSLSELDRADLISLDIIRSPGKSDEKPSKKLIDRRGGTEKSSATEAQIDKVDLVTHDQSLGFDQVSTGNLRKPIHGSNDKENEGKDVAENGFITTRKNKFIRTNDENSVRRCSRNKGSNDTTAGGNDGVVKRKVLAETTNENVQQCEAKAMEITGKWRCPQKSKPPHGPPLKQLRLEQWVHRV